MRRVAFISLLSLAACARQDAPVSFGKDQCRTVSTPETRHNRTMTGVCLVWNKIGDTRVCGVYQYRDVSERRQIISCSKDEWVE